MSIAGTKNIEIVDEDVKDVIAESQLIEVLNEYTNNA